MLSQVDLSEPALTQQIKHFVLSETAGRIEVFSAGHVQNWTIFDEIQILLKVLWALRVVDAATAAELEGFYYIF